jgi:hypothetical protein
MGKCHNKNMVEYVALKEVYNTDIITNNVINTWQSINGSDSIPNVVEAAAAVKQKKALYNLKQNEFGQALLNNLSRLSIVHSFRGVYYLNNTDPKTLMLSPSLIRSNEIRLNKYLDVNNISPDSISLVDTKNTKALVLNTTLFTSKDMLVKNRSWNTPRSKKVVEHLRKMFPQLDIRMMSVKRARESYKNIPQTKKAKVPFSQINSFYLGTQAILIKGRVTDEIAIEEILHPFIDAVKMDNVELFKGLLAEAKKNFPEMVQEIEDAYNNRRGISTQERDLEIVTQALARHFNKEYEQTPTQGFLNKLKEFFEWFTKIINNLNEAMTGKPLKVDNINSNSTLTDIAKLLNTEGISFKMESRVNGKVRYSLSPDKQKLINHVKNKAYGPIQKRMIDRMFHNASSSKKLIDELVISDGEVVNTNDLVILNKKDNKYYNINDRSEYRSVAEDIGRIEQTAEAKAIKADVSIMLDAISTDKPYSDIANLLKSMDAVMAKETFDDLVQNIKIIMDDGGDNVLLTNVVFHDAVKKVASTADVVMISKTGKLKLLQIHITEGNLTKKTVSSRAKGVYKGKSKDDRRPYVTDKVPVNPNSKLGQLELTMEVQDAIEIAVIRQMAENMGYEVDFDNFGTTSLNVSYNKKGVSFDGHNIHPMFENQPYVDKIVEDNTSKAAKEEIAEQIFLDANEGLYDTKQDIESLENAASQVDPVDYLNPTVISGALNLIAISLVTKQKALEMTKAGIFMDRSKNDTQENIANTLSYIAVARSQGPVAMSVAYTKILRDSLNEMNSFADYVGDPKNYSKPEYITYVLNFNKFLETFEGLYKIAESKELNATQRALVLQMEIVMTKLVGAKTVHTNGSRAGMVNYAIMDYVKEVIKSRLENKNFFTDENTVLQSHSGQDFVLGDLDALFDMVPDIDKGELYAQDLATSKDLILATMDQIFKAKKLEFLRRTELREEKIRAAGTKLLNLSSNKDLESLYDFMLEFNDDGEFSGMYTQRIGQHYYKAKDNIRNKLYDVNGKPIEYIQIFSLENASKADIKFNKDLYYKKRAFVDFMQAERVNENGDLVDGVNHRYTDEFQTIRSQYQYFQLFSNKTGGKWKKKSNVTTEQYESFKAKYFNEVAYTHTFKNGSVPTGAIRNNETFSAVRPEFTEIKDDGDGPIGEGKNLNPKWKEIMEPTDALGVAKKEFYEIFVQLYQKDMLEQLPMSVRNQMVGKVPVIRNHVAEELRLRPAYFTRMFPKFVRNVKNLFVTTSEQKQVLVDPSGRLIDTLPVYYTGSTATDEQLKLVENELDILKTKYKADKITLNAYNKERAKLESRSAKLYSQPTLGELSKDMATSLIKFSKMAEYFEAMGEIEDTMKAMVKAIEMRTYSPAGGKQSYVTSIADSVGVQSKFIKKEVGKHNLDGLQSRVAARAHNWMKMVYYDNEDITKNTADKVVNGLINLSSLSYVAFNVFGNFNNLTLGQINNTIEGVGGLFFEPKAFMKSKKMFYQVGSIGIMKRLGHGVADLGDLGTRILTANEIKLSEANYDVNKPMNLYEALVEDYNMMDPSQDLREQVGNSVDEGIWARFTSWGYSLNAGAEYKVQSEVGMAIMYSTYIKNKSTGKILSLADAYTFNNETKKTELKEGFDTIVNYRGDKKINDKEIPFDQSFRDMLTNNIREVNKQIHGNYAREDRMVIQNHFSGLLISQFHKWVMPAWRARFQSLYYDQNLGWLEGRYKSLWSFSAYLIKTAYTTKRAGRMAGIKEISLSFKEQYGYTGLGNQQDQKGVMKIQNVYRTVGEALILASLFLLQTMLKGGDDKDDLLMKRLKNFSAYQNDRAVKEMILMVPVLGFEQIYQMLKSPVASSRTLGELGEALSMTLSTPYGLLTLTDEEFKIDSRYVYQNKPRKGKLKLSKEWKDVIPVLYVIQKAKSFDKNDKFHIK